ncbi:MAG: O-antigen ligase family protein, partial [Chloroflexota bacterium]|nr:O-antigen ligase family protein [Chloroflexota bacterium]
FSGGFFTEPRLLAAFVAWVLVLALAIVGPSPLPRSLPGGLAVGGLALLTVWSALSVSWAPLHGPAIENVQRLVLYLGALVVAIGVLRSPRIMRAVEPALAAGATIVIGYGMAGRLVPGVVHLAHSVRATGRLEQPITYWNAEGALAAVGLVLCARLAGDRSRPIWMRSLAAASAAPLGAGVFLSYSRGAIAVAVLGLIVLVAALRTRSQLWAAGVVLATAVATAACSAALPGVASLDGGLGARERDGAVMLAILVLLTAVAAVVTARRSVSERRGTVPDPRLPGSRRLGTIAAVVVGLAAVGLVAGGLSEKSAGSDVAGARTVRLTSANSNRYEYWRIGLRAFTHHPIAGLGSGGFRVFWLRERSIAESVQEVHSLELEMAAELGIVGLLAFGLMVAGVGLAARRAIRRHYTIAAGSCAAIVVWLLHASIDWDWQLPAVSLPAIVLAGALVAIAESAGEPTERDPAIGEREDLTAAAAGDRNPVPAT